MSLGTKGLTPSTGPRAMSAFFFFHGWGFVSWVILVRGEGGLRRICWYVLCVDLMRGKEKRVEGVDGGIMKGGKYCGKHIYETRIQDEDEEMKVIKA